MRNSVRLHLPLTLMAVAMTCCSSAQAQIPVFAGHGQHIHHIQDLPEDVREASRDELGVDVSVGFLYSHFHIFGIDFWSWEGRHVLYHEDQYFEPEPEAWKMILGPAGREELPVPVGYRFPFGLGIVLALAFALFLRLKVFPSATQRKLQEFRKEPYAGALREFEDELAGCDFSDPEEADEKTRRGMERSTQYLRNHGIPDDEAQETMAWALANVTFNVRRGSSP